MCLNLDGKRTAEASGLRLAAPFSIHLQEAEQSKAT